MQLFTNYLKQRTSSNITIIKTNTSFFNAMTNDFKQFFPDNNLIREVPSYNIDNYDFRTDILKLKKMRGDYVGLFMLPEQLIAFRKQAISLDFSKNYFGTDLFESAARADKEKKLFEGCIYPDNSASKTFRQYYKKLFANQAQLTFAGNAYAMSLLVAEVLQKKVKSSIQDLLLALKQVQDRPSVLGKFSFKEDSKHGMFFEFPIYIKKITNGIGLIQN